VKKYLLLLGLLTGFFLAQGRESKIPVDNATSSYHHSKHSGLHSELDLSTSFTASSPLFRTIKKFAGCEEWSSDVLPFRNLYFIGFLGINNSFHSKSYLTHIHPSHHFW